MCKALAVSFAEARQPCVSPPRLPDARWKKLINGSKRFAFLVFFFFNNNVADNMYDSSIVSFH